jgi:hypothetical protein
MWQVETMNTRTVAGVGALAAFLLFSMAAQAQGACATPGTAAFQGLGENRLKIVPSVHRQLSSFGRMAVEGGCSVVLTCVADPARGAAGLKIRDRQCNAARAAMTMFEKRSKVRRTLSETFEQVKVDVAGVNQAAGTVYVTLQ